MKKIYLKPNTDIMLVELQQVMVQASLNEGQQITDSSDFGSRSYDYDDWDE